MELSAQAASLSCGWAGAGSANLTWTVDGEAAEDSSEGGSSSLRLVWAELGRRPGEVVFVSCRSEAGASGEAGAWASVAQVAETLLIPEPGEEEQKKEEEEDVDRSVTFAS